jgi:ABC-type dipeptide/oligopeptide/nickel transport system ATPase component
MSDFLKKYAGVTPQQGTHGTHGPSGPPPQNDLVKFTKAHPTSLEVDVLRNGKAIKTVEVPKFEMKPSAFLRKSTVLYGTSGSGKTVMIRDIMYTVRNHFARVWVFCPTNTLNQMYTGLVPNALIFDTVTIEAIRDIYEFQSVARQIYETANKIETLRGLFARIPNNQKAQLYERELIKLQETAFGKVRDMFPDPVKREEKFDKIREIMTEKLRQHYKQMIGMKADKLACMELTEEERYSLRYLGFCPDSLVIFDDAMMEVDHIIKMGKKSEDATVQNFFFKGRHMFVSTIYAMQSDKMFDPDLRKNTFTSIFTRMDEGLGYFSKASNGISPDEKRDASACTADIFSEENKRTHKKLIYLKDSPHKYQYVSAATHTRFPMCGDAVRSFCNRIEEKSKSIDKTSKFSKKFSEYAKTQ